VSNGGNSHQRKMRKKEELRIIEVVTKRFAELIAHSNTVPNTPKTDNPFLWLWRLFWNWKVVSFLVASLCISAVYVLAQEHMYAYAHKFIVAGALIVIFKFTHSIWLSDELSGRNKKIVHSIAATCILVITIGVWVLVTKMQNKYLSQVPQAYLHVDDVSVEFSNPPLYITAHINGHNVSTIVPTGPNPMVQACITIRPLIQKVDEEKLLFSNNACWVGSSYTGLNHALNPLEPFSFAKKEPQGSPKTGQ
jgi:hypothetical protein